MPNSSASTLYRVLPQAVLRQVQQLLVQMQSEIDASCLVTPQDVRSQFALTGQPTDQADHQNQSFLLLLSPQFRILLQWGVAAHSDQTQADQSQADADQSNNQTRYPVSLIFDPGAIAQFVTDIVQQTQLSSDTELGQQLIPHQQAEEPNDPTLQSDFTLRLLAELESAPASAPAAAVNGSHESIDLNEWNDPPLACRPYQIALMKEIEQGLLLGRVANQIRQSLDLNEILQTAVEQVRQLLQVDRLVIYQLDLSDQSISWATTPTQPSPQNSSQIDQISRNGAALKPAASVAKQAGAKQTEQSSSSAQIDIRHAEKTGYVAYESKASEQIVSVLNVTEQRCFLDIHAQQAKYQVGQVTAIADIETAYAKLPCLRNFLRQAQIRSKLIAPIVVQEHLWGLVIAHQCFEQRQWTPQEETFMQLVADQLAIAIRQARLYSQLQQQKQTLEQRVIERTQDLHDALLAAQAADAAKSEFLATMSHELRTPLTCVIGMSATLLRWSFGELNPRQRSYIQTIHDSGERLLDLINDILDMSQIEAGRIILDIQQCSVTALVSRVMQSVQNQAERNQVQLECNLNLKPEQDSFSADPRRLQQILLNLLTNAIKFTPAEGTVNLKVRLEKEAAIFQVEDTGIGISAEQQPFLFRKFQQLDSSRQRSYEGTGLGLALTKQLVDLHGGSLDVKSQVGVGSVFTVRIPTQPYSTTTKAANSSPEVLPLTQRVLLFEEDEDAANIICDMLMAAGHQVIWMMDGDAAVEQVKLMEPALVMVGMDLANIDRCQLIRQFRETANHSPLKILAIMADGSTDLCQQCLNAGADDCIVKPVRPRRLLEKIDKLFYSAPVT
ncbi:MAG: hybrid sensor histidine kinase/response regulator [Thainema sp.]